MAVLTHLPPEILHNIFKDVDPEDLARIPLTCRSLNNFIKGNNALCRAIYLRDWDEPPTKDLNFEQELHDIVCLKNLCSPNEDDERDENKRDEELQTHLPFVHRTVIRLLNHAVHVPAPSTTTTKDNTPSTSTSAVTTTLLSARQSRAQTFPPSRNAAFLTSLFHSRSARLNFLTRSFIHEYARAAGYAGTTPTQLPRYGSVSGSESDPDDVPTADGVRRRRPRRTRTRFGYRRPRRVREPYQMSAKLHCLYGWGLGLEDGVTPGTVDADARKRAIWAARQGGGTYGLACSKVYDIREYTVGTRWGPFLDGEEGAPVRVDWEKVEAILIVLGTNIRSKGLERFPIFWYFWGKPFAGSWGKSYIPWTKAGEQVAKGRVNVEEAKEAAEEKEQAEKTEEEKEKEKKREEARELDRMDPYGVSGTWLRVVSFLDYSDFCAHNFPAVELLPRDLPRMPLNVGQATRLLLLRMRVAKVEPPGDGDHPDHPVTYFQGFSRALDGSWDDNADADIRGTVRVTPEGEVRWTSYSFFQGEERWGSEGVQVGGIRSARGVVGNWFDKDFNPQGPCGPTAFWKISDRESTGEGPAVLFEDLFPLIADDLDEEIASDDDDAAHDQELFPDGMDPFGLEAFGADWAGYELEDELDGLYYFDDDDVFDVEDLEAELQDYEAGEEEDDDDGSSFDDDDELVFMGEEMGGAYVDDWGGGGPDDRSLDGNDILDGDDVLDGHDVEVSMPMDPAEGEEAEDDDDPFAEGPVANLGARYMPM